MRPGGNPLDLNTFPEDYNSIDNDKHLSDDTSSSSGVYRKKKSGGAKECKEEAGKVYECRFCSLKFCKSQALGGHMNRHRQERETETLNKARQLVFTNDLAPAAHLGYVSSGQPIIPHGGFHHQGSAEAGLPFRSMYPSRMFSTPPVIPPPPPPSPYMYPSPPHLHSFSSPYPVSDYFLSHTLSNSSYAAASHDARIDHSTGYTCIGAPVGHSSSSGGGGVRDVSRQTNQEEGLNWGRR